MQRIDLELHFSPSDLNHFVECEHLTALDLLAVDGAGIERDKDPQAELVRQKGIEHERAWLDRLRGEGRTVVAVAGEADIDWSSAAAQTEKAMRARPDGTY